MRTHTHTHTHTHTNTEVFLELEVSAETHEKKPLKKENYVSIGNPVSHSLIQGYHLNMGCCEIARIERDYSLISRFRYLNQFTNESKKTFLNFYESCHQEEDDEKRETDISKCFNSDGTPKNSQGRIAQTLYNGKKTKHFFQVMSPLAEFKSLIPNNLEISFSIRLNDDVKLFVTSTDCKPKLIVHSIKLICQFAILDQSLITRIEAKMISKSLQLPFFYHQMKTFAIEKGRLECLIDVSLR